MLACWRLLLVGCLFALGTAPVSAEPAVTFKLERVASLTLEGFGDRDCTGVHGTAAGINEAGTITGGYASSARRLAPWIGSGTARDRLESGHGGGVALAINDAGNVVGVVFDEPRTDVCHYPERPQPAMWQADTMQLLSLPDGAIGGAAWGMNDAGSVVGSIDLITATRLPAHWYDGGVETLVMPGFASGVATGGGAYGINSLGVVSGSVERYPVEGNLETQAVLWNAGIAEPLPGLGGTAINRAWAINDGGVAVGTSCLEGSQLMVAVMWRNGQVQELPELPQTVEADVRSINNSGEAVGTAWLEDGRTAVLWRNGEVIDLNEAVVDLDGLQLIRADAINDTGEIAAVGQDEQGYRFAVRLQPVT